MRYGQKGDRRDSCNSVTMLFPSPCLLSDHLGSSQMAERDCRGRIPGQTRQNWQDCSIIPGQDEHNVPAKRLRRDPGQRKHGVRCDRDGLKPAKDREQHTDGGLMSVSQGACRSRLILLMTPYSARRSECRRQSYEGARDEASFPGCTNGEAGGKMSLLLGRIDQRGAVATRPQGEATEFWPKPRPFMIRCAPRTGAWELA